MTREELKGKQTPGDVTVEPNGYVELVRPGRRNAILNLPAYTVGQQGYQQAIADGMLYAEAHNVANRTGMWPQDLEQRVKELEAAAGDPGFWGRAAARNGQRSAELEQRVKKLEEALKQAKAMMKEAMSLVDDGGKWDILHAPGTLRQGIREVDAILNKKPA